jgi:hypothetical protein
MEGAPVVASVGDAELSPEALALLGADHARGDHRDAVEPICPDCAAGMELNRDEWAPGVGSPELA